MVRCPRLKRDLRSKLAGYAVKAFSFAVPHNTAAFLFI